LEATREAYKCKYSTGFNNPSALNRHATTIGTPKTFGYTLCAGKFTLARTSSRTSATTTM
jgi:hypothetical protein